MLKQLNNKKEPFNKQIEDFICLPFKEKDRVNYLYLNIYNIHKFHEALGGNVVIIDCYEQMYTPDLTMQEFYDIIESNENKISFEPDFELEEGLE